MNETGDAEIAHAAFAARLVGEFVAEGRNFFSNLLTVSIFSLKAMIFFTIFDRATRVFVLLILAVS